MPGTNIVWNKLFIQSEVTWWLQNRHILKMMIFFSVLNWNPSVPAVEFFGRIRRYHPDYDPVTGQILSNLQIALEHQTWRASRAIFLPWGPWWEGDDFYWGLDHDPAWMRQEAMRATGKILGGTCFSFGDRWWVRYDQVLFSVQAAATQILEFAYDVDMETES